MGAGVTGARRRGFATSCTRARPLHAACTQPSLIMHVLSSLCAAAPHQASIDEVYMDVTAMVDRELQVGRCRRCCCACACCLAAAGWRRVPRLQAGGQGLRPQRRAARCVQDPPTCAGPGRRAATTAAAAAARRRQQWMPLLGTQSSLAGRWTRPPSLSGGWRRAPASRCACAASCSARWVRCLAEAASWLGQRRGWGALQGRPLLTRPASAALPPPRPAGYTASAGIAANKLLAKIGSAMHKPNQQTVIPPRAAQQVMQARVGGRLGGGREAVVTSGWFGHYPL